MEPFWASLKPVPVPLPQSNTINKGKLAFTVDGVFTKEECDELIALTEKQGYETAKVNIGDREILATDYRNSDRCIIDSREIADKIWERIKAHIPTEFKGRKVVELNERLRFLRYKSGGFFQPHMDGSYQRQNGDRTLITVQLYMRGDCVGGSTRFLSMDNDQDGVDVDPTPGRILVFQHDIMHQGTYVENGVKYCVRTDILYRAIESH